VTKVGYSGHVRQVTTSSEVVRSTNEGGLFIFLTVLYDSNKFL
jgi:hypothetical protein